MRVLAITKIFPNQAEPLSAPFNRQQFAALARRCELEVAATIPWFPGAGLIARWSSAGRLARVPRREQIAGISVTHPRTLFVPRLAHGAWGPLYAASIAPGLVRYRGKVDVVLGLLHSLAHESISATARSTCRCAVSSSVTPMSIAPRSRSGNSVPPRISASIPCPAFIRLAMAM